jgi:acyl-CoA hydrolase/RimJ/RimL family protein N-acetyltransferase
MGIKKFQFNHRRKMMAEQGNPNRYKIKRKTAKEAISMIGSGQRVFVGSSCGEPQHLVDALLDHKGYISDLEVMRLLSLEGAITALYSDQAYGRNFTVRSIYQGSGSTENLSGSRRFLTPMNISAIPRLFKSRQLPIHFALIQVSPPDEYGYVSLGISVDITMAAVRAADVVIAQVNPRMPRTLGQSFIHMDNIDVFVEKEEALMTVLDFAEHEASEAIAKLIANLIEDGSTFQLGLGESTEAILKALSAKNDLGVHTQFMTDGIMGLVLNGNITNRYKEIDEGKVVVTTAIGTETLYRFLHINPCIEFHPSDYVHSPVTIAKNPRMVSINVATAMDLTGQVAADALPQNHFSGVTGMVDFVTGAIHAEGGKSIIVIPSRTMDDMKSRIVPELESGAVVIPRSDVYWVVSEYGAANLFGKNLQERAMAMISLAHPDVRDELFQRAKETGLIGLERTLKESLFGVYPAHLEEVCIIDGIKVTIRPVKTVDIRHIQEHFYHMEEKDIESRFFQLRRSFYQDHMEVMSNIDYIKNMTVVAFTGEGNFGEIIGIGEYILESGKDTAEVAFSLAKKWKGKGVGKRILDKLGEAARSNGIAGFVAYTSMRNAAMIKLFKRLPYRITSKFDGEFLILSGRFDELAGKE